MTKHRWIDTQKINYRYLNPILKKDGSSPKSQKNREKEK